MSKLYYCVDCQRVFELNEICAYCKSRKIKVVKTGTSVNIIGTKTKGKVLKCKNSIVSVIVSNESKEKFVKEYSLVEIRKIL